MRAFYMHVDLLFTCLALAGFVGMFIVLRAAFRRIFQW